MKMTANLDEAMPTITVQRPQSGPEPDFVIQRYSPEVHVWRDWDCAYTRAEAESLVTVYERRYRSLGLNWRIAKIVYAEPAQPVVQAPASAANIAASGFSPESYPEGANMA